jgi:hypothetical protein
MTHSQRRENTLKKDQKKGMKSQKEGGTCQKTSNFDFWTFPPMVVVVPKKTPKSL